MGYGYARGLVDSGLATDAAIGLHLVQNCYPPMIGFKDAAIAAVEFCNVGDHEALVSMPEGVSHKAYGDEVPAFVLVEALRLEAFLDDIM
jgi:hypothetical protein